MDRGLQLLQQFRQEMAAQAYYIRRITCALAVTVSSVEGREVRITIEWAKKKPFTKVYTPEIICGRSANLQPLAWRIEGPPCQRAKILAQEALSAAL